MLGQLVRLVAVLTTVGTGEGVNAIARVQGTRLRACQHTLHRVRGEMALGSGA